MRGENGRVRSLKLQATLGSKYARRTLTAWPHSSFLTISPEARDASGVQGKSWQFVDKSKALSSVCNLTLWRPNDDCASEITRGKQLAARLPFDIKNSYSADHGKGSTGKKRFRLMYVCAALDRQQLKRESSIPWRWPLRMRTWCQLSMPASEPSVCAMMPCCDKRAQENLDHGQSAERVPTSIVKDRRQH